jgi:hypothetical protein
VRVKNFAEQNQPFAYRSTTTRTVCATMASAAAELLL